MTFFSTIRRCSLSLACIVLLALSVSSHADGSNEAFTCYDPLTEVLHDLGRYQRSSLDSEDPSSQFEALQGAFTKIRSNNPKCLDYVFNRYVTATLMTLHSEANWPVLTATPDSRFSGLFGLSALLAEQKRYRILGPSDREAWGGIWNEKISLDGHEVYRVMGAYDCKTSLIWLDPSLRPFDFGAVALHEISHLMRDKFSLNTQVRSEVFDELMASLDGSWAQFRLKKDLNRRSPNESIAHLGFFRSTPKVVDNTHGDLNLFSDHGPLSESWSKLIRKKEIPFGSQAIDFLPRLVALKNFSGVIDVISEAYGFSSSVAHQDFDEVSSLASSELDPLASMIKDLAVQPGKYGFLDFPGYHPSGWDKYLGAGVSTVPVEIVVALAAPTVSCLNENPTDPKGIEGSRPGIEGSRPGIEGSRPSKPSRPCLRLKL